MSQSKNILPYPFKQIQGHLHSRLNVATVPPTIQFDRAVYSFEHNQSSKQNMITPVNPIAREAGTGAAGGGG